ncbi:hypothetical protein AWB66_01525 [Caballeronia telluris]|uniref:Uncharacterized protein n=1 Tax=Caballeronia telluris TaxID=326475 RepID=A0A158G3S3_9BURK|nr:hypothetical protein AWB66_01525 [Caballeronia telluris]
MCARCGSMMLAEHPEGWWCCMICGNTWRE